MSSNITAYAIASLINKALDEAGRTDLRIRPQMMYNYAKNGLIVKGQTATDARYSQDQADAFVQKFVANRLAKNASVKTQPVAVAQVAKDSRTFDLGFWK